MEMLPLLLVLTVVWLWYHNHRVRKRRGRDCLAEATTCEMAAVCMVAGLGIYLAITVVQAVLGDSKLRWWGDYVMGFGVGPLALAGLAVYFYRRSKALRKQANGTQLKGS